MEKPHTNGIPDQERIEKNLPMVSFLVLATCCISLLFHIAEPKLNWLCFLFSAMAMLTSLPVLKHPNIKTRHKTIIIAQWIFYCLYQILDTLIPVGSYKICFYLGLTEVTIMGLYLCIIAFNNRRISISENVFHIYLYMIPLSLLFATSCILFIRY